MRIIKPRLMSRAAMISLAIAAGAAVLSPIAWRIWRGEEVMHPRERKPEEWLTQWRCEDGHDFDAPGQAGSRLCIFCDEPAYPTAKYVCPKHGSHEVNVVFTLDPQGHLRVTRLRLIGGAWAPAEDGIYCPRCGRRLEYTGDPLLGAGPSQRHGGE